jgi:2-keto-4-pentenoate hydratase/2-oxohepta-3-ene-1,7-dioic acid hydratase in catechol pathway
MAERKASLFWLKGLRQEQWITAEMAKNKLLNLQGSLMKLGRFVCRKHGGRKTECYGLLLRNRVLCFRSLAEAGGVEVPINIDEFMNGRAKAEEMVERLIKQSSDRDIADACQPMHHVKLLAPIPFPPKIVCLGLNYRDHVSETNGTIPDEPVIFMKPRTAIIGPNEKIVKPNFVKKLDYEGELAVVVGRRAKNVSVAEARSVIFGYTILNDISARDIQFKDKQWTRGKSFDTFAPTGPCVVTSSQLRDASDLSLRTWVNGELRQDSTTKNMVFNDFEIVHHLSLVMTLEPCDIIATGTPAGVGFAMKPRPKYLHHGDTVKIEIEKIGILENRVA